MGSRVLMTGMYSAVVAQAGRDATGQGEHIDIGMLGVSIAKLANQAMNH